MCAHTQSTSRPALVARESRFLFRLDAILRPLVSLGTFRAYLSQRVLMPRGIVNARARARARNTRSSPCHLRRRPGFAERARPARLTYNPPVMGEISSRRREGFSARTTPRGASRARGARCPTSASVQRRSYARASSLARRQQRRKQFRGTETTLSQAWSGNCIRGPQCAFEMSMFMCPAVHKLTRN